MEEPAGLMLYMELYTTSQSKKLNKSLTTNRKAFSIESYKKLVAKPVPE